jgi:hypothetical protein
MPFPGEQDGSKPEATKRSAGSSATVLREPELPGVLRPSATRCHHRGLYLSRNAITDPADSACWKLGQRECAVTRRWDSSGASAAGRGGRFGCAGYGPKAGIPARVAGRHEPAQPGSCDQALPVAMTLTPKRARAEDCAQAESTLRAPTRRDRPGFLAS